MNLQMPENNQKNEDELINYELTLPSNEIKDEKINRQLKNCLKYGSGLIEIVDLAKYPGKITVVFKELFNFKGCHISAGSKLLENYISEYDAQVVQILKNNQFNIMGVVACDEFGSGDWGENTSRDFMKKLINLPGGSSSGSALAIINDCADVAVSTDTGGSTLKPAYVNKIIGYRPTYGAISRWGLIPLIQFFDTVSFLGKKISEIKTVFKKLNQPSDKDPTSKYLNISTNKKFILLSKELFRKKFKNNSIEFKIVEDVDNHLMKLVLASIEAEKEYLWVKLNYFRSNTDKYDGIKFSEDYNLNKQNLSVSDFSLEKITSNRNKFTKNNFNFLKKSEKKNNFIRGNVELNFFEQYFNCADYLVIDLKYLLGSDILADIGSDSIIQKLTNLVNFTPYKHPILYMDDYIIYGKGYSDLEFLTIFE